MKKKRILIIVGIVLLVAAAIAAFLLLNPKGFTPSGEDKKALEESLGDEGKALTVFNDFRYSVDPKDLSVHEGLDENWEHILLLGTDTHNDQLNDGRSDAMLIVSINTQTKELKLTSLVRDMLVDIPLMKSQQRINTANAFGGPLLAVKTVNELLGLNITKYCSINFSSIISIVDMMGGIDVTLSKGEANIIRVGHSDEPQRLNGLQTMTYVRIRKIDNNFGRNERQRKVLIELINRATKMEPKELLDLVTEALKHVSTNLSTAEIISLLPVVVSDRQDIDMLSLPPEKAFKYGKDGDASVLIINEEKTKAAFHSFIGGAPSDDVVVQ